MEPESPVKPAAKKTSALRKTLKVLVWLVAGVVIFVVSLLASGYAYIKSARGRDQVIALGVQQFGKLVPGGFAISGVEGDLTTGLIFHDVVIRDREGEPAVRADRLELLYRLLPLLHTKVQVSRLKVDGLVVVSRDLLDGTSNLGTMLDLKPSKNTDPTTSLPVYIEANNVEVNGRFVMLPPDTSLEEADDNRDAETPDPDHTAALELHAQLQLSGALTRSLVAIVDGLNVRLHSPAMAQLSAHGTLGLNQMALDELMLRLEADTSTIRAEAEQIRLRGPLVLTAEANGALAKLGLNLHAHVEVPQNKIMLDTRGMVSSDRAKIDSLVVTAPFADVKAHGAATFTGDVSAKVHASVSDLSRLQMFGAPKLGGKVTVDGEGSLAHGRFRLKANGSGSRIVAPGVAAHSFAFDVDTKEFIGRAHARAEGLAAGGFLLTTAKVDADSTEKLIKVALEAVGPEKAKLGLRVAGTPHLDHGRFVGLAATIDALQLSIHHQDWKQTHPATLTVDLDKPLVELRTFDLASGVQKLSLAGKISGTDGKFGHAKIDDASVMAKMIDMSQLAVLISPGHTLPRTEISATVSAHGPLSAPDVSGHVGADVFGRGDHDNIHLVLTADGQLANRRLVASANATIAGQHAHVTADLPIPFRPNVPVSAELDASVLLNAWFAEMLVPKLTQSQPLPMFQLYGTVTAKASLKGTSSKPELHANARLLQWHLAEARGDLGVSVEYAEKQLKASFSAGLSSLAGGSGNGGGIIDATAQLPLDLPGLLSGEKVAMLPPTAELHANAHIRNLGLEYLPLSAFEIDLPAHNGRINATVDLAGTIEKPNMTATVDASKFDIGMLHAVGANLRAELAARAVTIDASASVDGSEAFRLHTTLNGDPRAAVTSGAAWRHARIDGKGSIPEFRLDHLHLIEGMGGTLTAALDIGGQISAPRGTLDLHTDALNVGVVRFKKMELKAELDNAGLDAKLDSEEEKGAILALAAKLPWKGKNGTASLVAHQFVIDIDGKSLSGVRTLRGKLDGNVAVANLGLSAAHPTAKGNLTLSDGQVRISSTAMDYHGIAAKVRMSDSGIVVDNGLLLAGEKGRVDLSAHMDLSNGTPTKVGAKIVAHKFPFQQQGIGVLLEAEVDIDGARRSDGSMTGKIRVVHGAAALPELLQTRVLLPTGPLEDVTIAHPIRHPAKAKSAGLGLEIGARIDGPFAIRGKEINASLQGAIKVDLSGRQPALRGSLKINPGGWIDLLAQRYDIDRGIVAFDGSPDPLLSFRISRRTPAALIGIDVTGAAKKPTLAFWSDPPVYDATQVAGLVLSGDPGTNGVSTEGLDRQAVGAISSLLVTSIKQKLLPELPIDVFRFNANDTPSGQGAQIEVGKYIADKLYVGYAYQLGAQTSGALRANTNEARLEYRLPKNMDIEATFGDAGIGGLDLFWTWRPKP